jgi:outer membrane receptor for ferrienterochelin and colicins
MARPLLCEGRPIGRGAASGKQQHAWLRRDGVSMIFNTGRPAARALAALTLLCSAAVRAQTVDYGGLEQLLHEPITTSATGSPQRVSEVPVNMQIISAKEIRQSGADNIPDILRYVAGVDVRRYSYGQADVSVRGYDKQFSPRLLVLINGRQAYNDAYGYTDWSTLPVQMQEIRQIEVVKGPNSALFGFNAVSGVVNIITYDPLFDSTRAAQFSVGTQHDLSASGVFTAHLGDDFGVRLSAGRSQAHEFDTSSLGPTFAPYNTHPHKDAFSADARWQVAPQTYLGGELTLSDARQLEAPSFPYIGNDAYQTNSQKLALTTETDLGLLNITGYRNEFILHANTNIGAARLDDAVYVLQASDLFKLGSQHALRLGVEYRYDSGSDANLLHGSISDEIWSANAMWNWQIRPRLAFTTSVRVDHLRLHSDEILANPQERYSIADFNRTTLTEPTFNSGLVYRPTDTDTIRLTAARGLQAPSLADFGLNVVGAQNGFNFSLLGAPDVKASAITSYEVDYARQLPGIAAELSLAAFFEQTQHLIANAVFAPSMLTANGLVSYTQNFGDSRANGGELELRSIREASFSWSLSYSHILISEQSTIDYIPGPFARLNYTNGTPAHVVTAQLGHTWNRFEWHLQARWQSHYMDYFPTVTAGVVPGEINNYTTLDLHAAYHFTETFSLGLTAQQANSNSQLQAAGVPVERRVAGTLEWHW